MVAALECAESLTAAGLGCGKKVTDMGFPPFYFSFDYAVMRTNVMWASQRLRGKEPSKTKFC